MFLKSTCCSLFSQRRRHLPLLPQRGGETQQEEQGEETQEQEAAQTQEGQEGRKVQKDVKQTSRSSSSSPLTHVIVSTEEETEEAQTQREAAEEE